MVSHDGLHEQEPDVTATLSGCGGLRDGRELLYFVLEYFSCDGGASPLVLLGDGDESISVDPGSHALSGAGDVQRELLLGLLNGGRASGALFGGDQTLGVVCVSAGQQACHLSTTQARRLGCDDRG